VGKCRQLESLILVGTIVTDAGLTELAQLNNLRLLMLNETGVTGAGVRELQKALPGTAVHR
jgi:hypothetical protein